MSDTVIEKVNKDKEEIISAIKNLSKDLSESIFEINKKLCEVCERFIDFSQTESVNVELLGTNTEITFVFQGKEICSVDIPNEFPKRINLDEKPIEQKWGFLLLLQLCSAKIKWKTKDQEMLSKILMESKVFTGEGELK